MAVYQQSHFGADAATHHLDKLIPRHRPTIMHTEGRRSGLVWAFKQDESHYCHPILFLSK